MTRGAPTAPTPHRFTRQEYHRLAESHLLADERVELLDGVIITMSPQNSPHAATIHRLLFTLLPVVGDEAYIRVQAPIVLDDWSEPEPDIVICQPDPTDYAQHHPRADQVMVVIEVADSSLVYDQGQKAQAYAASGIPEYWVVNLADRTIAILTNPSRDQYQHEQLKGEDDSVFPPGGQAIAVSAILPPQ